MKTILFSICLSFGICGYAQQHEEAAILKVIEKKTSSALKNDFETCSSCWAQKPYAYLNWTAKHGNFHYLGREAISQAVKEYEQHPDHQQITKIAPSLVAAISAKEY